MKSIFKVILMSSFLIAAGCGSKHSDQPAQAPTKTSSSAVAKIEYFRGGGFPGPGTPTFANDLTIVFGDTAFTVTAKVPADPLCSRSGSFSEAQADALVQLINSLQLKYKLPSDPMGADFGVETVKITFKDGSTRTYQLAWEDLVAGDIYVTNPTAISDYLKALETNLQMVCAVATQ